MTSTHANPGFINDDGKVAGHNHHEEAIHSPPCNNKTAGKERETWGKGIEFLLSCIAMSVGLGNVWRFPFTALDNGGGAFLIPYLIVLFLIGKPIYYLEMIIGQFSSRGSVKVFDLCPAMRGVGIGQVLSISIVTTYYVAIMGITVRYLIDSFRSPLPWAECQESWDAICVPSSATDTADYLNGPNKTIIPNVLAFDHNTTLDSLASNLNASLTSQKPVASAELYFV